MEVDSGNDKGSYAIAPVEEEIVLDKSKIITWSDYKRQDNEKTFGLLCQASPDGRHIVGTVKDRALAVYTEQLAFSQLFFLVKGILAVHDIFPNPADGGQAPYEIFKLAKASGLFEELPMVGTLGVLRRL